MIKYFNTVSNERGDVLANYRVQVVDSLGASVNIFADAGGTRFTDSGGNIVNYTEAQANGRVAFYWTPADGQVLQTLDASGNLVDAEADFANAFVLANLPGNIGQNAVTGLVADLAAKTAVADLASTDPGKGASLVGYRNLTVYQKLDQYPSSLDGGTIAADGVTDDTAALQAFINAHPGEKITLHGSINITSSITIADNDTTVVFRKGAKLVYTTATLKAIVVTGDNVDLVNPRIEGPATFDGTNAQATYANIWIEGDGCTITRPRIDNVPRVGIMFSECNSGKVIRPLIKGNFPQGSFTGVNTGHAGIVINTPPTGRQGDFQVEGGSIESCVQGILVANYGAASRVQAISAQGVHFFDCWDHGFYAAGLCNGLNVSGNIFTHCHVPVAVSGSNHIVANNVMTTGGSTGENADQPGISVRDAQYCTITGNTLQGESSEVTTIINLLVSLGTVIRGNVVTGNTILATGSGFATLIALGGATCTDLTDNIVSGNVCKGLGRDQAGLISLSGEANCPADGTKVIGNSCVALYQNHGVMAVNLVGAEIKNNSYRLEYDAAAPVNLAAVLISGCSDCDIAENKGRVTASWGANISLRNIWEAGTASGNRARNNTMRANLTKLVTATAYATVSGSGIIVHDTGAGAPNLNAGVGSTWTRTNGGVGTITYIKESGTGATGWRAINSQAAAVTDPTGGATIDAECRAQLAAVIDALQASGQMAA